MKAGRARGQVSASADAAVEDAFARVLAAEDQAEQAVRECQARAEALDGEVDEALQRLAERAAARRARWREADAAAEAAESSHIERACAEAERPLQLDADDRCRLARAVALLAGELCGDGAG